MSSSCKVGNGFILNGCFLDKLMRARCSRHSVHKLLFFFDNCLFPESICPASTLGQTLILASAYESGISATVWRMTDFVCRPTSVVNIVRGSEAIARLESEERRVRLQSSLTN